MHYVLHLSTAPSTLLPFYTKMENIHHKVFKIGFNHDASYHYFLPLKDAL